MKAKAAEPCNGYKNGSKKISKIPRKQAICEKAVPDIEDRDHIKTELQTKKKKTLFVLFNRINLKI